MSLLSRIPLSSVISPFVPHGERKKSSSFELVSARHPYRRAKQIPVPPPVGTVARTNPQEVFGEGAKHNTRGRVCSPRNAHDLQHAVRRVDEVHGAKQVVNPPAP